MTDKRWNAKEVKGLTELAARKGYSKKTLAAFMGINPATLSIWLAGNRGKDLPLLTRNGLSYVEERLLALPDKPTSTGRERGER